MAGTSSKNERILVVDDDAGVRSVLASMLEVAGYAVQTAANGKEALDLLAVDSFDLIITDLVMPEQEGIETIKILRRDYPQIRVIAMSGAFGGDYLKIAGLLGAHSTMPKPLRMEKVLEIVEKSLADARRD